jgi:L-ascorbate metabolism protein UlaG (beta-lactamase superfamily)
MIWYLGRSGWAIKTTNHLLIFDYSKNDWNPDVPSLSNGYIPAEELVDQNVYVFVTNGWHDRYDTKILEWQKHNNNITYIFGFDPNKTRIHRKNKYNGPDYEYIGSGQYKNMDSIEIFGIKAIESDVGYLVKVDGISFFHLGNHVIKKDESFIEFKNEIDNFMQQHDNIDIAFIPIRSFRIKNREPIIKGFTYAINKLKPKVTFPMQALELEDHEYVYKEYAGVVHKNGCTADIICADNSGDRFFVQLNK